jgi:hypothetical protein
MANATSRGRRIEPCDGRLDRHAKDIRTVAIQDRSLAVLAPPSRKAPELTVPPNETEATTRPDPIGDWTTRARSLRVARESLDEMRRPLFQNEKRQQAGYEPPGGFKGCLRSSSGRVQIRGRSQASSPASGLRPTPSAIALSSGSSTTGRLGRGTKRVTARTPPRWPP